MAEYEKKVREILKQNGCYFVRHGKGDHDIWYSPITNTHVTELMEKSNRGSLQMQF